MVIIAAVPLTCDGSSAYYSQGTTYNPYAGWTESVTSSGTVYVYYGTEVDITFVVEDDFDEVTVTTTSANCGLSIDGLRVHGTMTSYSAVFQVSGLMDGYEYPVYSLTIRAKNLIPVDGANVGSYYECDLSGGEYSGYSVTGGHLPSGLALHSDGVVKGTPSEAGTFYFTTSFMNRGVQVIYDRSINIFGS